MRFTLRVLLVVLVLGLPVLGIVLDRFVVPPPPPPPPKPKPRPHIIIINGPTSMMMDLPASDAKQPGEESPGLAPSK